MLWHIWKARNAIVFKESRYEAQAILNKALEDSDLWFHVNRKVQVVAPEIPVEIIEDRRWSKPQLPFVKCNIGSSWISHDRNSGASWLIRDYRGVTIVHGRRSFSRVPSHLDASLLSFQWPIESVKNLRYSHIIFEISSPIVQQALSSPNQFPLSSHITQRILEELNELARWEISIVPSQCNKPTTDIAVSVTNLHKYQSYIAREGPRWLQTSLDSEANN